MYEQPLRVAELTRLVGLLARLDRDVDDVVRVDRIRALEDVKAACAAAQAVDAADLDRSRREAEAAQGVPARERGRGVGAEVALARRESPHRGARHLGLARALVNEMPGTLDALRSGRLSEWRATLLVRETACLTRVRRTGVDSELAGTPEAVAALERLGDRALVARARQVAYRLDPAAVVERSRRAERERCVTLRPAPDAMAYLTALLPLRDAVTVHVALQRTADTVRATGDPVRADGPRTRGQVMADTLVDTLTAALVRPATRPPSITWAEADTLSAGRDDAGAAAGTGATAGGGTGAGVAAGRGRRRRAASDVAVRLVMTDRALLDGDDEPAHVDGYGPVPAAWARRLVATTLDDGARVHLTRLFTGPGPGALVAMESGSRLAPAGLADVIRTRDAGTCRTPWCDAPARHVDHVTPHSRGGPTAAGNLRGLCEACNYREQLTGWRSRTTAPPEGDAAHTVRLTTPTGHGYDSTAPPLPGSRPPGSPPPGSPPGSPPPVSTPLGPSEAGSAIEEWLGSRLALAV